jgi:hypothetical protein
MEMSFDRSEVTASKYASLHSSLDRRSGELFRAMGDLYVASRSGWTRQALARELQKRLADQGVGYHLRTLKRQLTGAVRSVPPQAEEELRRMLVEARVVAKASEVESAVGLSGEHGAEPAYVEVRRLVPLTQLWLALHPGRSKRSLAEKVRRRLDATREAYTLDSLQAILAGKQHRLARRAVLEALLAELSRSGLAGEEQALERFEELRERGDALGRRDLVAARDFVRLCRAWQVRTGETSSRRLARGLRARLSQQGLPMSLAHAQALVNGRVQRVRRAVLEAIRSLVADTLAGEKDPQRAFREALARADDLEWRSAGAASEHARDWLREHPDSSLRELARRLSQRVERMGYSMKAGAIQPVLSGAKSRTRGFLLRALIEERSQPDAEGQAGRCRNRSCVMPAVAGGYCRACWLSMADPRFFARHDQAGSLGL